VIFLVGDYPPHMDYNDDVKYPESCRLACTKGIVINTIQCGNIGETEPLWREIAAKSEGEFFKVEQSGNVIAASTPFDGEIAELSRKLDETRLYYGNEEQLRMQAERVKTGDKLYAETPADAVAARAIFNAGKAGERNFTGSQELIDDIAKGKVKLSQLKENELDKKLQALPAGKREAYIADMAKQRDELQQKIQQLGKDRQKYIQKQIREKNVKENDSLDQQIYQCIKTQGGKKDIKYVDGPVY
jgi:Skp family chaperone for outer membrane proteins